LQPHCLLGLKFLLPIHKAHERLHRHIIISAFPDKPRWQWILLLLLSLVYWFGYKGWRQLFTVARKYAQHLSEKTGKAWSKVIKDLFILTFYYGISPSAYFNLRLYCQPRDTWLDFVFPQELSNWHSVLSCPPACTSRKLLGDKEQCAAQLQTAGIRSIETLAILHQGEVLNNNQLFDRRSLFIKPVSANGMRGCLALYYDYQQEQYSLKGKTINGERIQLNEKELIFDQIQQMLKSNRLLIQPMLENNKNITMLCHTEDLVTLRIVSGLYKSQAQLVYAILEIPSDKYDRWWLVNIDCESGLLTGAAWFNEMIEVEPGFEKYDLENYAIVVRQVEGKRLPFWHEISNMVTQAHALFNDVLTIGWDLAITPDGPVIIEGNTGWGVVPLQSVSAIPLLRSRLREIYLQRSTGQNITLTI
jgi:putative polysaccharide biosynthesis protein